MKDLDFDELDRAVNSLMSNVSGSDKSAPEETEKTLAIPSKLADEATPAPKSGPSGTPATPLKPADPPKEEARQAPLSKPSPRPLAARRGGRFMDVVHPSSDMKTATTTPPRPPVSRQGVTIAPNPSASKPLEKPTPPPVVPAEAPVTPEVEPPMVSKSEQAATVAAQEQATPASEWPDPLEMAGFKSDSAKKPEPAAEKEKDDAPAEPVQSQSATQDEPSPLTSPFLPDTKVEKRPLGGTNPEPADEPDRAPAFGAKPDADLAIADPSAQLPPSPTETAPELPEELKSDLVAIEADTATHPKNDDHEELATVFEPSKKEETPEPAAEKPAPAEAQASSSAPAAAEEKPLPAGPTSIPQQYREEPSTGDQDNGAIYDTDTYHQPLAHPAKKQPGWLWVVLIILILALGAGAGAGLYLLGIV